MSGGQLSRCDKARNYTKTARETNMKRDQLIGRLKQFNGKIKEHWCMLHGDQMGVIAAKRYQVAGWTQTQSGISREKLIRPLRTFDGFRSIRRYH